MSTFPTATGALMKSKQPSLDLNSGRLPISNDDNVYTMGSSLSLSLSIYIYIYIYIYVILYMCVSFRICVCMCVFMYMYLMKKKIYT